MDHRHSFYNRKKALRKTLVHKPKNETRHKTGEKKVSQKPHSIRVPFGQKNSMGNESREEDMEKGYPLAGPEADGERDENLEPRHVQGLE